MYADAHAHIHDPRLTKDTSRGSALERAAQSGLDLILAATASPVDWLALVGFLSTPSASITGTAPIRAGAEVQPAFGVQPDRAQPGGKDAVHTAVSRAPVPGIQIATAFGLHPAYDDGSYDATRDGFPPAALRPQAIGEIGLDHTVNTPLDRQCTRLAMMLKLAAETGLPVVLHARGPWNRLLAVLDTFPSVRGIVHAFGGSPETACELSRRGYLLSAGPRLLDPAARRIRESFSGLPLASIVLESDAPDMCPPDETPPNEPAVVVRLAGALSALRGEPADTIAAGTRRNLVRLLAGKG